MGDSDFYKGITAHEKATVKRSQIKGAPYNPRKITKKERENLYKVLDSHKLVTDLVWNARTGNLVSGHQRLSWIDLKAREKGLKDFDIDVNKVDVDEKTEMELNLAMNNDAAMGKFDLDMLGPMLDEIDYSLAGFDDKSLDALLGGFDAEMLNDEDLRKRADDYAEGIEHRKRMQTAKQKDSTFDYYSVLVFRDFNNRQEFFAFLGMKDEQHVDGNKIMETLRARFERKALDVD